MATQHPTSYFVAKANGEHDFAGDVFKLAAMQVGFSFDQDTDDGFADVSASELATASGYTTGGATVTLDAITQNDTLKSCDITFDSQTWTATGGTLTVGSFILYNSSTSTASGDATTNAICAHLDPGTTLTAEDGEPLLVKDILLRETNVNS